MGTSLVPDSEDLLDRLRAGRSRSRMRELGALIAGMHAAGVFHADLNLKNILVAERLRLIDLEASACHDGVPRRLRIGNLERLLRSAAKHDLLGRTVTRADLVRFLQGYDAAHWKEWFAAVAEAFRRGLGRHRLFWQLERARNS
jgi:tRNA A-37 threonylcarbamoyl transferase component Bud32